MDSKGRVVETSDKTDKPAKDQLDAPTPEVVQAGDTKAVGNVDAPAVEDGEHVAASDDAEPVEVQEPKVEVGGEASRDQDAIDAPAGPKAEDIKEAAVVAPAARSGFAALLLGGVVAAGLGFGAAFYLGDQLGFGAQDDALLASLQNRLEVQGDQLAKFAAVQGQIGEMAEAAQAGVADVAYLRAELTALQGQIDTTSGRVDEFHARLTDIEKRPLTEGLSAAAVAAYEREVEDLKKLVSAQKADAAELKDRADISAKTALARSAATRVVTAVESGASYRAAVVDFASATGQSVPEVIEAHADSGVVTLGTLSEAFPEQARAALAVARDENAGATQGSKIGNFFKTHLGARSVEPKAGTDTDAVLSRAEAALRQGRLQEALTELDGLSEGPKTVMSQWRTQADTRLSATRAAEELAQSLNRN